MTINSTTTSSRTVAPVEVERTSGGQRATVRGRIDVHSVPDVRLVFHAIIDTGLGDLDLDLSDAEIGDATALGMVVECYLRSRRAGRGFGIVAMTERTGRLLRAARLERALVLPVAAEQAAVAPLTA